MLNQLSDGKRTLSIGSNVAFITRSIPVGCHGLNCVLAGSAVAAQLLLPE